MTEENLNVEISKYQDICFQNRCSNELLQGSDLEEEKDKNESALEPQINGTKQTKSVQDNFKHLQSTVTDHKSKRIDVVPLCDNADQKTELCKNINLNSSRGHDKIKNLIAKHIFSCNGQNNYTRGCLFSPDGLCVLTYNEDNTVRLFDTPRINETTQSTTSLNDNGQWPPSLSVPIAGPIYDVDWYPLMNSADPVTCCLAVTSQYQPIHLYDAYDGHLRATYRYVTPSNHERFIYPSIIYDDTKSI